MAIYTLELTRPSPDFLSISVKVAKADLFGITISTDNCVCGCPYPVDYPFAENYLWDLKTNINMADVLQFPFQIKPGKTKEFWDTIFKFENDRRSDWAKKFIAERKQNDADDICDEYTASYEYQGAFELLDGKITINTNPSSGIYRHCGSDHEIPIDKVKKLIVFNKSFINFLPRLQAADYDLT